MFEQSLLEAAMLVILFSGLPLLAGVVAGLLCAIAQTATQIQEQTITYVVKFSAITGSLAFLGGWAIRELCAFLQSVLTAIAFI